MAGPLITLGDTTSHGGTVIEASPHSDTGGKAIARMGDKTVCPKHGPSPIVSGDATLIIDGKPAARHGDKTACGATLVAGQQATIDNL
ncbi:PAAR domain-containing protein [Massilia consociata]|uniref:PAAR domain-containing protein n=1 Tax=Massilia consociata TaxID=760117 RepID=A0ABV6FFF4_9BURK